MPDDFQEIKKNYLADKRAIAEMKDMPPSLVINWDHTATKIVPSSQWTMEKKGTKRVEIVAVNDNRQITAVMHPSWKVSTNATYYISHTEK